MQEAHANGQKLLMCPLQKKYLFNIINNQKNQEIMLFYHNRIFHCHRCTLLFHMFLMSKQMQASSPEHNDCPDKESTIKQIKRQ